MARPWTASRGTDSGLWAGRSEDGRVEAFTAGASTCALTLWLHLARQSGGITTLLPAPECAGSTRLQSNAIGWIPVEGVTMSEPSRLLGSSSATATSVPGRLTRDGASVCDRYTLDRDLVRLVGTGLGVQLASDQRKGPGGYVAAFVDSDGAEEGCGHHSTGYARTRLAHGLGLEPALCKSAYRWRSTNGP